MTQIIIDSALCGIVTFAVTWTTAHLTTYKTKRVGGIRFHRIGRFGFSTFVTNKN